jgi:hypothetical protein
VTPEASAKASDEDMKAEAAKSKNTAAIAAGSSGGRPVGFRRGFAVGTALGCGGLGVGVCRDMAGPTICVCLHVHPWL